MSVPALPRDAKSWLVENTVNRILRFLNPGFGADNAGKVLTSNSTGTDLAWQLPTLSYLTDALTADVTLNSTTTWFTGPSVAQGTSGIWLAMGKALMQDTANAATFGARLTDGTTVFDSNLGSSNAANAVVSMPLVGIISAPAGNIRIEGIDVSSTSGKMLWNGSGLDKDSSLTVMRIG